MAALDSWREEQRAIYLYRVVAQAEPDARLRALFDSLAEAAARQSSLWESRIRGDHGDALPAYRPDVRTRLVAALVRRVGPRRASRVLAAAKVRGMAVYDASAAPAEGAGHPVPQRLSDVGRRHKGAGARSGGNLRAAVFGINDGLVSNASLLMGIAGAAPSSNVIVLTGVAGLLAGAFSMAAGEYVSMRSQRELHEYQIALEREELAEYPEEEAQELALIYEAKGVRSDEARRLAHTLVADPERALDALSREELGLDPDDLGSPWGAASFSFVAFALGAALPLLPFVVASGAAALLGAIAVTGVALFVVGATISLFTGTAAWRGGLRMLSIGAAAAAATWGIGRAIGVSLG